VLISDAHAQVPQEAANYRQLGLPPLSKTAEHVAKTFKCFDVLDADPRVAMLPGAAEPDFVLRVRPVEVKTSTDVGAVARRMGAGLLGVVGGAAAFALGGVGHGVGSGLIGGTSPQGGRPTKIDSVSVGIEVVCPKLRRVAADFTGTEALATIERDQRYVFQWPADKVNVPQEVVARAYMAAQAQLIDRLSSGSRLCAG
jgi:hypothetical protein